MKSPIAAMALLGTLAACVVLGQTRSFAQGPGLIQSRTPRSPFGDTVGGAAPAADGSAPGGGNIQELTPAGDLKAPEFDLPEEPIEPFLLTKDAGPFMVLARVFRGPDAQRMAIVLAKELRAEYGLPAFILRKKEYPGGSMIRGMPPTAPSEVNSTDVKMPEKIRTFDEAAVLVGNEKTHADQEKLWHAVKKIQPRCLEKMSSPYPWRRGLSSAIRTTNPYVPAQNLYPRADRLIMNMNGGLRSIINCPGAYSLQVADYSGRTAYSFNPNAPATHILAGLTNSPLRTAHEDAERMAEKLAKAPEIRQTGQPVYVYHDRTSSKVFIGAFNSPQDPAAAKLRQYLIQNAYNMSNKTSELPNKRQRGKDATDTMIVPAVALTDVNELKSKIK
jgi:hypothetical protein